MDAESRPAVPGSSTDRPAQHPSSFSASQPVSVEASSTPAAMKRDGVAGNTMSAVGEERKSHDDRKSHDLQHDSDVIDDAEAGSDKNNSDDDEDATISFSLAVMVGCILLLLNIVVFVGTMCQWPRLRRRRRRCRKQRHAAALAALTSLPVNNHQKLDGGGSETVSSASRCDTVTEETRLTLLCPDEQGSRGARVCDGSPDCRCMRAAGDGLVSNYCDGAPCATMFHVELGASTPAAANRLTADNAVQSNHVVFSRNQFTTVWNLT